MKQPVDHILRPALPWRDGPAVTECGLDASAVSSLSREDFIARVKEMGHQRAHLFTCMTCSQTARNYGTWADDPRKALAREIAWETVHGRYSRGNQLLDELHAIASLIEAHPEEFAHLVAVRTGQREWNEKKAKGGRLDQ